MAKQERAVLQSRVEGFVIAIVTGGVAMVVGLWALSLSEGGTAWWSVGLCLGLIGVGLLGVGIGSQLRLGRSEGS